MMRQCQAYTLVFAIVLLPLGCGENKPKVEGSYDFYDNITNSGPDETEDENGSDDELNNESPKKDNEGEKDEKAPSDEQIDMVDPIMSNQDVELEELEMEDHDALATLIADLLRATEPGKKKPRLPYPQPV
jgi:hypothetical protein